MGKDAVQWLENNSEPWYQVLEKWRESFKVRQLYLERDKTTIQEYYKRFPCLKQPCGYSLVKEYLFLFKLNIFKLCILRFQIELDFSLQFENSSNLFDKWPLISEKIIKLAKGKNDRQLKEFLSKFDLEILSASMYYETIIVINFFNYLY